MLIHRRDWEPGPYGVDAALLLTPHSYPGGIDLHTDSVLLIGGDRRQTYLARLLSEQYSVSALHVPGFPDTAEDRGYEIVVLPCPAFFPDGRLRTEGETLPLNTLLSYADKNGTILGGGLSAHRSALERACGRIVDLLEDETVLLENAGLTAEAALALTLTETGHALCRRRCLLLGWGRIAKRLGLLLRDCGAEVTVAVRSESARAEAGLYGFRTAAPSQVTPDSELVFNTVPARCLPETTLWGFSPDCVWVELASAPGGLPQGLRLPLRLLPANALPGRLVPRSAAEVLYRGIVKSLR